MEQETEMAKFVQKSFAYKGESLKIFITRELEVKEEGVEWSEFYLGVLYYPKIGTFSFLVEPAPSDIRWEILSNKFTFERDLVDIIADMIALEFDDPGTYW